MAKAAATKSAIEILAEMEAKHRDAVREIKEKAIDELREKLKDARAVVNELQSELEQLTGIKAKVGSGDNGSSGGKRSRISSTLLAAISESILKTLDKKTETSVTELAEKTRNDVDNVRSAIAKLKRDGKVKSNGQRGNNGAWLLA